MWMLNTETIELHEFSVSDAPEYTILSHTWGLEEVLFQDLQEDRENAYRKSGFRKLQKCCELTRAHGFNWTWIDTCCIDKRSSAELNEAINSMYVWYSLATCCYVYLEDIPSGRADLLHTSRWFTRGWTLQELIAPDLVSFYDQDWGFLNEKPSRDMLQDMLVDGDEIFPSFVRRLSTITGIPEDILIQDQYPADVCIAQRMSWASQRETTKEEDKAYCLMGLFDVNIPVLYGEGVEKAFRRLQLEIISATPDQTIFAWTPPVLPLTPWHSPGGLLAPEPRVFESSGKVHIQPIGGNTIKSFHMTNAGLSITLPIRCIGGTLYEGLLECSVPDTTTGQLLGFIVVRLVRWNTPKQGELNQFVLDVFGASRKFTMFTGNVEKEFEDRTVSILTRRQSRYSRTGDDWSNYLSAREQ